VTEQYRVGVIGAGNMGSAIINSISQNENYSIIASRRTEQALKEIKNQYEVEVTTDNNEVVSQSDVIILGVKPNNLDEVLKGTREFHNSQLWISIAAGKTIQSIEEVLGKDSRIIRCMPNIGMNYGTGVVAYSSNEACREYDIRTFEELFQGKATCFKTDEANMNLVTASASFMGNIGSMLDTFTKSLVKGGLSESEAKLLTRSILETNNYYISNGGGNIYEKVASKGGTTEAAEKHAITQGLHRIIEEMVLVSIKRCEELEK